MSQDETDVINLDFLAITGLIQLWVTMSEWQVLYALLFSDRLKDPQDLPISFAMNLESANQIIFSQKHFSAKYFFLNIDWTLYNLFQ